MEGKDFLASEQWDEKKKETGGGRGEGKKGWMERKRGNAHDLLCKRRRNELGVVNSEAPPIRHSRLKTWPISGENKKEARLLFLGGGRVCVRVRAGKVNGSKQSNILFRWIDHRLSPIASVDFACFEKYIYFSLSLSFCSSRIVSV